MHLFKLMTKYDSFAASYLRMLEERHESKVECKR